MKTAGRLLAIAIFVVAVYGLQYGVSGVIDSLRR